MKSWLLSCIIWYGVLISLVYAAEIPSSNVGNIDCGQDKLSGRECVTHSCISSYDCVNPTPDIIGGLDYGCLSDVKLCGWMFPKNNETGYNKKE